MYNMYTFEQTYIEPVLNEVLKSYCFVGDLNFDIMRKNNCDLSTN